MSELITQEIISNPNEIAVKNKKYRVVFYINFVDNKLPDDVLNNYFGKYGTIAKIIHPQKPDAKYCFIAYETLSSTEQRQVPATITQMVSDQSDIKFSVNVARNPVNRRAPPNPQQKALVPSFQQRPVAPAVYQNNYRGRTYKGPPREVGNPQTVHQVQTRQTGYIVSSEN